MMFYLETIVERCFWMSNCMVRGSILSLRLIVTPPFCRHQYTEAFCCKLLELPLIAGFNKTDALYGTRATLSPCNSADFWTSSMVTISESQFRHLCNHPCQRILLSELVKLVWMHFNLSSIFRLMVLTLKASTQFKQMNKRSLRKATLRFYCKQLFSEFLIFWCRLMSLCHLDVASLMNLLMQSEHENKLWKLSR